MFKRTSLAAAMLLWFLLPASATLGQKTAPQRIPAEAFGELPFFGSPVISPNGRRIVAQTQREGKSLLTLLDTEGGVDKLSNITIPDEHHVMWARWAGDERVLMSLAIPSKLYGLEFHSTRILLYDLRSRQLNAIEKKLNSIDGDNVIYVEPDGKWLLISMARTLFESPSVWRVELPSMEASEVVKAHEGVWSWFPDSSGIVRAGLGSSGQRWGLLYRNDPEGKFQKVVRRNISRKDEDTHIEKFIPMTGSDKGYAVANRQTGRFGLYRYDFSTDTLGEAVFEHPEVDIDDFDLDSAGAVAAVHYQDDRARIEWLDPEMKKLQGRIDRALPGSINRVVSMDAKRNRMIVSSVSAADPGTYFLFDQSKKPMAFLAKPFAALEGKPLAPMEAVRYQARDGLSIPAYLTKPLGGPAKALPLVLMPHGGPFVRDSWGYDPWVQFLANRGYAVLQPNFRGSTGYGRSFVEAGEGQWGRRMQDDLDDGVKWLVSNGIVDPKRVCIMGASYGGYAAMWAAVRSPDVYRCAISFAGISDAPAMLKYDRKHLIASRYFKDWRDRIRGEESFDLGAVSPIKAVERIQIPILIAHGGKDSNVPVAQSTKLHEAMQKAGKLHDYIVYPEEGHSFGNAANAVDFLKKVDAFLAKHNPAE